ncbi:MAG: thiol-disulfide isomerase/thioredoxin [Pseudorhodobacter sp.]|jgi:thiol-disulfide isomerase/thioredoxin
MRKLVFHSAPKVIPEMALTDLEEGARSLSEWQGRWVVLNFWATWCAPCRHEMPGLDRLADDMSEAGLAVVTVATGRNPVPSIQRFFTEIEVKNLPGLRDPKSQLARSMGVLGLPVTMILNPEGQEVARLIGDAEWDSPEAKAVLTALIAD